MQFRGFSVRYRIKNFLIEFLWFIDNECNGIRDMDYDVLVDYYHYLLGTHTPSCIPTINGAVHGFLLYCYDINIIRYKSLCFMCHKLRFVYFDQMTSILKSFQNEFDRFGKEGLLIDTNERKCFDEFLQLFIDEGYKGSKIKSLKIHLGYFYLFLDYTGYRINPEIIRLWADKIIGSYQTGFMDYRNELLRFFDFINNGKVDFDYVYRLPNQYINNIPEWAKNDADQYLNYRKRLNYKENTLCMDRNSILRFCLFLDEIGVHSFSDINSNHILQFNRYDQHSTVAGKNAYMVRIKNFLVFLYDNGIITFNPDIHIATYMRTKQKAVETIDDETLKKNTGKF